MVLTPGPNVIHLISRWICRGPSAAFGTTVMVMAVRLPKTRYGPRRFQTAQPPVPGYWTNRSVGACQ